MAQLISKLLFCRYTRLKRRARFVISGSHDHKLVCLCNACKFYTGCNFNRVPERKTLPNRLAKAKLLSLFYFLDRAFSSNVEE
jgi:hypothetical protein